MPTPALSDTLAQEAVDALEQHETKSAAAEFLGIPIGTFKNRLKVARQRGFGTAQEKLQTLHGHNPEHDLTHVVPSPLVLRGTSSLYGKDGGLKLQWVKTSLSADKVEEMLKTALKTLSKEVEGLAPVIAPPSACNSDLLAVYPMGDPHYGMHSWAAETGDDFDLKIAKELTFAAVDRLLASAPAAETAIILPLGDVFHNNDQSNATPGHHNQLDVDSRYVKILAVGIEIFRHVIFRALQKHDKIVVRFVAGNHDPQSIWVLAFTIHAYFSNEPRVTVDLSPSLFWFYRFGQVLIGATHGDTAKHEQLLGVMACDRATDWGETKYRYFYTGHVHHQSVKEFPGLICESFRTLAAKDAYAAGHGYRAGRDMVCIVHHKEYGEIERHRCDIGMI